MSRSGEPVVIAGVPTREPLPADPAAVLVNEIAALEARAAALYREHARLTDERHAVAAALVAKAKALGALAGWRA